MIRILPWGLAALILVAAGCRQPGLRGPEAKMDARLRMALNTPESSDPLNIMGQCDRPVDPALRKRLESTGIVIRSVVDRQFTAAGHAEPIRRLAELKEVTRLTLGKPVKPLEGDTP